LEQLAATQLAERLREPEMAPVLIDVREPWEYELCHIAGSRHIPLSQLPTRLDELEPERPYTMICHHGMRSEMAGRFLENQGFMRVTNLVGGIAAWAETVEPTMTRY
jgi:rhodanese-related sulfurtransferase